MASGRASPLHFPDLAGEHQESQRQEQHQLHQPGVTVKAVDDGLAVRNLMIPDKNPADVNRQEAVAMQKIRKGIREQHQRDSQNRVQTFVTDFQFVDHLGGNLAHHKTHQNPDRHLHEQHQDRAAHRMSRALGIDHAQEKRSQQERHRVVTPALELQQGLQVVFKRKALGIKDIEHGRRIGRRDNRAQQQGFRPREARPAANAGYQFDRYADKDRRQHHA